MAYNVYDTEADYVGTPQLVQEPKLYLSQIIRETNEWGNGFEADIYIDDVLEEYVSFDMSHLYEEEKSEDGTDSVALLMSPEAARKLADRLYEVADAIDFTERD